MRYFAHHRLVVELLPNQVTAAQHVIDGSVAGLLYYGLDRPIDRSLTQRDLSGLVDRYDRSTLLRICATLLRWVMNQGNVEWTASDSRSERSNLVTIERL